MSRLKENRHVGLLIRLYEANFACFIVGDVYSAALNSQAVDG